MQRFFSILAEAVERFEGTVDKFTGDGIMAVFGAPIAHEDHARRACYAALQMLDDVAEYAAELRRGHGLNFSTRIGINSGEVVAGAIGVGGEGELHRDRPHRRPGPADGGAGRARQGLPDREHRRAGPRLSSSSRTSASSRSRARASRSGSSSWPGSARRARGSTSRASAASPASSAATRRWRCSRRRLERAERGEGAAVGIVAEPGVGKSRLCHEFAERCRERGIEVFEAPGPGARAVDPLHAGAADAALLLRHRRRRPGADRAREDRRPGAAARPRLRRGPAAALRLPRRSRSRPAGAAAERRGAPAGAARRRLPPRAARPTGATRSSPVVEDLHWMDEGSATLLGELVSSVEGTKTLAIVNFRPEYDAASGPARRTYRGISLEPLGPSRHPRAAARPGRRGPLARRARRADPRAHRRQPVLHRGDRPRAGRGRQPRGRARRLPAGAAGRGRGRAGQRADDPRRPHRPPRPDRQAAAAGRLGDRQGDRRAGAGDDLRARARTRTTERRSAS